MNKRIKHLRKIYEDNVGQYWILPKRTKIKKIMKLKVVSPITERYEKKKVFVKWTITNNEIHIKPIMSLEDR